MLFVQPPQMLKKREYKYHSLCVQEAYRLCLRKPTLDDAVSPVQG